MSFITNFDQSNKADWTFDMQADAYDGSGVLIGPVDFTGASVALVVADENGCHKLSASIGSGITQSDANTLEVLFVASQMKALYPGSYKIGCVYSLNGSINQLLSGTVSIYDGVAQI